MAFNQGAPAISHVISTANCLVFGNTSSGNALSVQQLGAGNVATFQTSTGATALFINPAGRVGVGTASPSAPLSTYFATSGIPDTTGSGTSNVATRFQVGSVALDMGNIVNGNMWLQNHSASNWATNYPLLLNPNGGNVGVGTTNPSHQLTVNSNIYNQSSGGGFYGMNCGNLNGLIQGVYNGGTANPDGLSNSDMFIGVNYDQQTGQRLAGTNHGVAQIQLVGANPGAGRINFRCAAGGTGALSSVPIIATVTTTGVGIGTTNPASTLDLAGGTLTSRYITSPGGNYLTIQNGAGGSAISLLGTTTAITGGAVYMTGGNVGIGTDAPAAKLGVVVSGSATVSGPSWDANWFTVGTAGNSIANAVGLGWSTGGNNGILACVQPTVGWRNMAYTAAVHDFYIAGTFVTSIRNAMTGGATTISVDASGFIQRGAVSDKRLKSNIMTMTDFGLATITGLRPVTYEATPESLPRIGAGTHVGLVAQEVEAIFPYAVSADQDEQKTLTIDYIKLVPVMINAFKELSAENTALKTQLTAMDARLAALESKLAA